MLNILYTWNMYFYSDFTCIVKLKKNVVYIHLDSFNKGCFFLFINIKVKRKLLLTSINIYLAEFVSVCLKKVIYKNNNYFFLVLILVNVGTPWKFHIDASIKSTHNTKMQLTNINILWRCIFIITPIILFWFEATHRIRHEISQIEERVNSILDTRISVCSPSGSGYPP